jgi:voltage-gated potassium channel Kch
MWYPGRRWLERRTAKYLDNPPSVARAAGVIIAGTAIIVVASALVMRFFDREKSFTSFGESIWWATQTVTTVGYGDIVPTTTTGRVVGIVVMLAGIAFAAVLTAVITSSFVARSQLGAGREEQLLKELGDRLDRIERSLALDHPDRMTPTPGPEA